MESIWDVARQILEMMLDELVECLLELPDGEEKRELSRRINALDEALMAETGL